MSKRTVKPETKADILKYLEGGEKTTAEIKNTVSGGDRTIDTCLSELKEAGKIVSRKQGLYALPASAGGVPETPAAVKNSRGEAENTETINKMLNLFDECFDDLKVKIKSDLLSAATVEETINLIKSLRWLGATVDQLMKRWYLVHRGYDNNTRQAVEDAKQKTENREQQALERLPPAEQLEVVGDYDVEMHKLLASLPEAVEKEVTV